MRIARRACLLRVAIGGGARRRHRLGFAQVGVYDARMRSLSRQRRAISCCSGSPFAKRGCESDIESKGLSFLTRMGAMGYLHYMVRRSTGRPI